MQYIRTFRQTAIKTAVCLIGCLFHPDEDLILHDYYFLDCGMGNSGSTYIGTRNVTSTGRKCQAWSSNSPHQVAGDIKDDQFPDNSRGEALNYCRNPQASSKSGIWCYTTDPNVEWEYCDPCPENYGNYHGMVSLIAFEIVHLLIIYSTKLSWQ